MLEVQGLKRPSSVRKVCCKMDRAGHAALQICNNSPCVTLTNRLQMQKLFMRRKHCFKTGSRQNNTFEWKNWKTGQNSLCWHAELWPTWVSVKSPEKASNWEQKKEMALCHDDTVASHRNHYWCTALAISCTNTVMLNGLNWAYEQKISCKNHL